MNKVTEAEIFSNSLLVTWVVIKEQELKSSFGATLVVRNPPAHTGDMGLIPDLGRSHMLQSNEAHVPQLFSLCSRAQELQLLKLCVLESKLYNNRSHCNEKPTPQLESSPREKPKQQWRPSTVNTVFKKEGNLVLSEPHEATVYTSFTEEGSIRDCSTGQRWKGYSQKNQKRGFRLCHSETRWLWSNDGHSTSVSSSLNWGRASWWW